MRQRGQDPPAGLTPGRASNSHLAPSAAATDDRLVGQPDQWQRQWQEIGRRIELPLQGLREVEELRRTLDRVERELVAAARRNWSSWEEIGGALGISRQAAHARHGPFVKRKGGSWPRSSG